MKKGLVSIIIPHWNGKNLIKQTLKSIKQNTLYKKYEVIVVDNNSTDGSIELLKKMRRKGVIEKLLLNNKNEGFAFANNQGFELSEGEFCFMLSNDTEPQGGWLKDAVEIANNDENIAAVGIQIISPKQFEKKDYVVRNEVRVRRSVCGAAMLMRKYIIELIGPLDAKNFSPVYGEETDWTFRARNAGFKIVESKRSVVVHVGSPSSKRRGGNKWQYMIMNTHRLKAMLYNLGLIDFISYIPGLALIFLNSIRERKTHWLIESYWNNFKNLKNILRERKKRIKKAKEIKQKLRKKQLEAVEFFEIIY